MTIKRRFDQKLRVGWTRTEMVDHIDQIQHELIREALRKTGITEGVEITTMGNIPSDSILSEQKINIQARRALLGEMKQMAYTARAELLAGNIDCIGELLDASWQLKKRLAGKISNGEIDQIYQNARRAGAIGGKISGAGGGGFLLLYCPHERQEEVRRALQPLQELSFKIEPHGSKVIFDYQR